MHACVCMCIITYSKYRSRDEKVSTNYCNPSHFQYILLFFYLNGTFHISYNTGFSLAGVRLAPRPESIKERRLSRRTSGVIRSAATSSTFRAITTTITATGGTGSSTRSLSTALARTGRA